MYTSSFANPKGMGSSNPGDKTATYGAGDCQLCHVDSAVKNAYGPHGKYTTGTTHCASCHVIHNKVNGSVRTALNAKLLVGESVTSTCQFCHDLTASDIAPYSTTKMSHSSDLKAAHRIKGITSYNGVIDNWTGYDIVPGGDEASGGNATLDALQGELSGAILTCNSCHTPHGLSMIKPYLGESEIKSSTSLNNVQSGFKVYYLTTRLLKTKLQVGSVVYSEYGSAWCAGCHQGRLHNTGLGYFNHPVDKEAPAYDWGHLAAQRGVLENGATAENINSGTEVTPTGKKPISVVVYDFSGTETTPIWIKMQGNNGVESLNVMPRLKADPRTNMWYTMTAHDSISSDERPDGYRFIDEYPDGPACQQCHASARDVEQAFEVGTNPETTSFPHISKNRYLLIENDDDLCTNCHGLDNLP